MVRKVGLRTYMMAAVVTLVIFSVGINFGYFISKEKFEILKEDLENLNTQRQDTELELALLNSIGKKSCDPLRYELEKTTSLASSLGDKLIAYDIAETVKVQEYYSLKDQYMITLIKYWLFWNLFNENCNASVNTVLYFYSIDNCPDCIPQGLALSTVKSEFPKELMVFSLDYNSELDSIGLLKINFNITTTPTLIINNVKYEGFKNYNSLKETLNFTV